jgi:hypothetical protein
MTEQFSSKKRKREQSVIEEASLSKKRCITHPIHACKEYMKSISREGYQYNLFKELLIVIKQRNTELEKLQESVSISLENDKKYSQLIMENEELVKTIERLDKENSNKEQILKVGNC